MDPTAIVNLALAALQAVLTLIANIKSQSGLTDDQILAQAQALTAGDMQAYNALVAALTGVPPATTTPAPTTPPAAA